MGGAASFGPGFNALLTQLGSAWRRLGVLKVAAPPSVAAAGAVALAAREAAPGLAAEARAPVDAIACFSALAASPTGWNRPTIGPAQCRLLPRARR